MNKLVYGKDPEKNLVGAHLTGGDKITLYTRSPKGANGDGEVTSREVPFHPFALLSDEALEYADRNFARLPRRTLRGGHHYRHLVVFDEWWDFFDIRGKLKRSGISDPIYAPPNAVTQYFIQSGKTLFLGMEESDVVRMQIDIETYSERNGFPQADRAGDSITIISLSDNRGYEKVLHLANPLASKGKNRESCPDEESMLRAFIREVHRRDPDVLELHNGYGYDLPYIEARCERYGLGLCIGRDSKAPRTYDAQKKFAEREIAFTHYDIAGRAVIDTMFLAMAYDVITRDLPGFGLKVLAKHFGFAKEERVYVDGDRISWAWDNKPDMLLEYALDDVRETRLLSERLGGAIFYLTQMVPSDFQKVHLGGSAAMIETLMVRGYLDARHSIPRADAGKQKFGGKTRAIMSGRFEHIVYADVDSLYPGIMLNEEGCLSPKDNLGCLHELLSAIREQRFVAKRAAKAAKAAGDENLATTMQSKDGSFKVVINSVYGAQGFPFFAWNDFAVADNVAIIGQSILDEMVAVAEELGGHIIEIDTDGVMFIAPQAMENDLTAQAELVQTISDRMSRPWVSIGMDGLYAVMLSYRAKNYALVDYDGNVKVKGGAFKNRRMETFLRNYLKAQVANLLANDIPAIWRTYEEMKTAIYTRTMPIADYASKSTLKSSIKEYQKKILAGNNRQAQYDLAMESAKRTGRGVEKGDVVSYYIAGDGSASTVRAFEDGKLVEDYAGDENVKYYLKKLYDKCDLFRTFFSDEAFGTLFAKPPRNVPSRPYVIETIDQLTPPDFTGIFIENRFIDNDQ